MNQLFAHACMHVDIAMTLHNMYDIVDLAMCYTNTSRLVTSTLLLVTRVRAKLLI